MGIIQQFLLAQVSHDIIDVLKKGHIVDQVAILHVATQQEQEVRL